MSAFIVQTTERDLGKYATAIRQLAEGRSNAVGSVTLTANDTSTVVTAQNCGPDSFVYLMPKTANAAAALATTYIATIAAGTFTVTHANTADADKEFGFICLG